MEKRFVCSLGKFQNLKSIVQTLEKMGARGRRQVQERALKHVCDYTFRQEGSRGERAMGGRQRLTDSASPEGSGTY